MKMQVPKKIVRKKMVSFVNVTVHVFPKHKFMMKRQDYGMENAMESIIVVKNSIGLVIVQKIKLV